MVSLAIVSNLLPFILFGWLWIDQPRHRSLAALLFAISVLFYALMYWSLEGNYFFVPFVIYLSLIGLSAWMLVSNALYRKVVKSDSQNVIGGGERIKT
jgi:hypothetical protein